MSVAAMILGAGLGLRHALEADHLATLSNLVAEKEPIDGTREEANQYGRMRRGAAFGALWGLGHGVSLVALAAVFQIAQWRMSRGWEIGFEVTVALVLIGLGIKTVAKARGGDGTPSWHAHRGRWHQHPTGAAHVHALGTFWQLRPLLFGALHGAAGSGALIAILAGSRADGVAFAASFGIGAMTAMACLGAVSASILRYVAPKGAAIVFVALGVGSIAIGVVWLVPLALSAAQLFGHGG